MTDITSVTGLVTKRDQARNSFPNDTAWRLQQSSNDELLKDFVLRNRTQIAAALSAAVTLFTNAGWGAAKDSLVGGQTAGETAENAFLALIKFEPVLGGG